MIARLCEKKQLSARGLLEEVRAQFQKIEVSKSSNAGKKTELPLVDCLMSALAVFSLKCSSLLQFDELRDEQVTRHNLGTLFGVKKAPCDTQLRERLDPVCPDSIRSAFKAVFSCLQRGKVLEKYQFIDGHYLLLADGTGFFSSPTVHCQNCCVKHHRDGSTTYYHQMLGAAIVHPDFAEVVPICPEPIVKEDGSKKNDCERNASKRLLRDFRREHPHLPVILVEDGLASNAPHLRMCQELDLRFITVVKREGNRTLFEWLAGVEMETVQLKDGKTGGFHRLRFENGVPLNDSDPDLLVNFVEYWEYDKRENQCYYNTWVTDLNVTRENVLSIARGGRARWRIENETFNTLKNQGYNFEHNYGHGKKNLSTVLARLMMLAFLIDQTQQMCCGLFQAAWAKSRAKIVLWDRIRGAFFWFKIESWEALFLGISKGIIAHAFVPNTS